MREKNELCPVCGMGKVLHHTKEERFEYKGVELEAKDYFSACDTCGTEMATRDDIRNGARSMVSAKLIHDGLFSGKEISEFRTSFGLTQKLSAQLFGGGEIAFSKYENDGIAHNLSMDRLLKLCKMLPLNLVALAKIADVQLPAETISALQADFASKFSEIGKKAQVEIDRSIADHRPKYKEWMECANDQTFHISQPPRMSAWKSEASVYAEIAEKAA